MYQRDAGDMPQPGTNDRQLWDMIAGYNGCRVLLLWVIALLVFAAQGAAMEGTSRVTGPAPGRRVDASRSGQRCTPVPRARSTSQLSAGCAHCLCSLSLWERAGVRVPSI